MAIETTAPVLTLGEVTIRPVIDGGLLRNLGTVQVGATDLRNPATRFLPWFDTFEGDIFRQFAVQEIAPRGDGWVISTRAFSDPDTMFRERRDCSGDLCFRNASWDDAPLQADLRIGLAPAQATVGGIEFTGFKYWFEYQSDAVPIHRLVDRQTWEVGGNLDDVTLLLRNWLTPPRMKVGRDTVYSTVGLDKWAGLLPGNLWGRWTLLPSFDLQYGADGVLLAWFDEVSLIRTVIESNAGEDCLRVLDMHCFEQAQSVSTNAKTVLYAPAQFDEVDALNFWTRVYDLEAEKSQAQFGIQEEAPAIVFSHNVWRGFRFGTTYDEVMDVAEEFGADYVFIDPVWEHQQAFKEEFDRLISPEAQKGTIFEKFLQQNMCVTLDFEVADIHGGEAGLKALCDRARAKGLKIISWMATHYSPNSALQHHPDLKHGAFSIFAGRESGRHPDTGYATSCWTANLNGPVATKMRDQLLGVCARTGLSGFLWDSFCNLGWWQLDYPNGTMRPQHDKMAELYRDLTQAGLYLMPEAVVTFSSHSCCGLHGGNIYADDLLGYSYNTNIGLWYGGGGDHDGGTFECQTLTGQVPFDTFFQCFAYKRVPGLHFHMVPREQWDAERVQQIKDVLAVYKTHRDLMQQRTVLKDYAGVLWENGSDTRLLFSFRDQPSPVAGAVTDARTGEPVTGDLQANRAYSVR